jgi:hypothetical protein
MATIYRDFPVEVSVEAAWAAVRDFGALDKVLARGFIVACEMDADLRTITFANGMVVREQLVGIDEGARRLAYTIVDGQASYHHASAQVFADDQTCRFVWITDVLPDSLADPFAELMDQGVKAIKETLES